jgi:hypothetical protein
MPFKCKKCSKGFLSKQKVIAHVVLEHGVSEKKARYLVYHNTPQKERVRRRIISWNRQIKRVERIKEICESGTAYPCDSVYCPVCHVSHSKSYLVLSDKGNVMLCRNCYKDIMAEGSRSFYFKSRLDGDFESNK